MRGKILYSTLTLIIFLISATAVLARSNEQLQHDLINAVIKKPASQWEGGLKAHPELLNLNFLNICEERAKFALVKSDYAQAILLADLADKAAELMGAKANYSLGLAFYFYRNNEYNMSLDLCRKLAKTIIKNPTLNIITGLNYFATGDYKKAEKEYLSAIQLSPASGEAHYRLGLCYKAQNDMTMAQEEFKKAVNLDSKHIMAKEELEESKGIKKTKTDENTKAEIIKNTPSDPLEEAQKCIDNNQTDKAEEILSSYLQIYPNSFKANMMFGKLYAQTSNFKEALNYLDKAKKADETSAEVYYYMGYVYEHIYEDSKKIDELKSAKVAYQHSLSLDPEYSFALNDIKRVEKKIKEHKDAKKNHQLSNSKTE